MTDIVIILIKSPGNHLAKIRKYVLSFPVQNNARFNFQLLKVICNDYYALDNATCCPAPSA